MSLKDELSEKEVYDSLKEYLFPIAYRIIGNLWDAEDLVQNTFLSALGTNSFKGESTQDRLKPWLRSILINESKNYQKKNQGIYFDSTNKQGESIIAEKSKKRYELEIEGLEKERNLDTLKLTFERLPQKYGEVLTLLHYHKCSLEDIVRILALPLSTVKGRINNGYINLRLRWSYKEDAA